VPCIVAAACAASLACGRGGDPDHPLGRVLLDTAPRGYERVEGPSGPMDLDLASRATTIGPATLRPHLSRTGFQEGYSRVWQREQETLALLVFDFISAQRAGEMVELHERELGRLRNVQPFEVGRIEGARGFTVNATKPRSSEPWFCQIVVFAVETKAFEVRSCSEQPLSADEVQRLARDQARRAAA